MPRLGTGCSILSSVTPRTPTTSASKLTEDFMRCSACFGDPPIPGLLPLWPPRGWAGPEEVASPSVMLVSLNPGHPLKIAKDPRGVWNEEALLRRHGLAMHVNYGSDEVVIRRKTSVTPAAAGAMLELCWRSYRTPTSARDHLFHRRSVAYARAALWLCGVDSKWESHSWFTDLVKCSTVSESRQALPKGAILNCRAHLSRELDFVQPSAILALGAQAYKHVTEQLKGLKRSIPVLRVLHPARWRKLTDERQLQSFKGAKLSESREADSSAFREHLAKLQAELE